VTSFNPGEAIVFAGGDPARGTTYTGPCEFAWTMGYDDKGNLVGIGEEASDTIVACALLAGSTSMIVLSGCCTGAMQIDFPGGTMWDGKYIAVGDQETGGAFQTGIYQSTLSGSTLTEHTDTVLSATCYNNYSDVVQPFIVGLKNTAANKHQGTIVVGSNLWCADGSTGGQVECWNYPTGGSPVSNVSSPPEEPYGQSVSLPAHGALGVHRSINPTCDSGV